ncbi:MAG: GNAT family N-acetyltransferase, partial [Kiritimatiellae bacterium]|nr:GNAT family N-acetyltransferase [Kiritimatiellia bacterium]
TIFREYPYLYQGSLSDEEKYLSNYTEAPDSLIILALDESGQAIGASTCLPLTRAHPEFQAPFHSHGLDPAEYCYFGESVLLPPWRGRGLGGQFFDFREAHARSLPGVRFATFCAVDRPTDHPLRPETYRSPEPLWHRRHYQRQPHLTAEFSWQEVNQPSDTPHQLTFWVKPL